MNYWFLADMSGDRPSLVTDLRTALAVAAEENDRAALPASLTALLDGDRQLRKKRDREFKRLEGLYEKDRLKTKKTMPQLRPRITSDNLKAKTPVAEIKPSVFSTWKRAAKTRGRSITGPAAMSDTMLPSLATNGYESPFSQQTSDPQLIPTLPLVDYASEKPVKVVSVLNSRTTVAIDYTKRNFVFRIVTEDGEDVLLQAPSMEDMLAWVKILNDTNAEGLRKLGSEPSIETINEVPRVSTDSLESKHKKPKFFGKVMDRLERFSQTLDVRQRRRRPESITRLPVFGTELIYVMTREQGYVEVWTESNSLPVILAKCLAEVERRGLTEVGIYRISGTSSVIQEVKSAFDNGWFRIKFCIDFRFVGG
jgi:hypothetical protein